MLEQAQTWFSVYTTTRGAELRDSSRRVYGAWWNQYTDYLEEKGLTLTGVNSTQVRAFLETDKKTNTGIRYFRLLTAVYETAQDHDLCKTNPLADLSPHFEREEESVTVVTVPADALQQLYSIKPGGAWKKHRDRVLVLLTAEAGLRRSELLTLHVGHLRLDSIPPRVAIQNSRTAEKRDIELSAQLAGELRAWLAIRAKAGLPGVSAFPASSDGTALNPSTVYRIIERHLDQVGVGKEVMGMSGARVLRASLAQRNSSNRTKLPELQKVLGHRQLLSTADLVDRVHPFVPEPSSS